MIWKTDIKTIKEKTMLKIKHSKPSVMLTLLDSIKNLPILNKETQNYKLNLTNSNQSMTKRSDKELPNQLKSPSFNKLSMKPQPRDQKKIPILKLKEKNSPSFQASSLKQEDSSQITYKPQLSYKKELVKLSTIHHKSLLKLHHT